MPCIKGRKSPSERFAGAEETYTIEALMQVRVADSDRESVFKCVSHASRVPVPSTMQRCTTSLIHPYTITQNGWALQSGTSHFLGQNFARAFNVFFQTESNERELVWATSWVRHNIASTCDGV